MGCGCGSSQAVIKYRLTLPDRTHIDFDDLDNARQVNTDVYANTGSIRTVRVVVAKT